MEIFRKLYRVVSVYLKWKINIQAVVTQVTQQGLGDDTREIIPVRTKPEPRHETVQEC